MSQSIVLKNGLRVHLVPVPGTQAVTVLVLCQVGSRYENNAVRGAAHFIEHLMFKGTARRPTTLDLSRELDAIGAQFNAYTGKDHTGYFIKADAAHARLAVDMLNDMLFFSKFDPEEFAREKKVIVEEINMYEDNPLIHVEELLEAELFAGNDLGLSIAGTRGSIEGMKREDLLAFRAAAYAPDQMVVAVAGKIPDDLVALLESTFGSVPAARAAVSFAPFAPSTKPLSANVQFKETEQVQLMLGFPGYAKDDPRLPAARLLSIILGGTMSSRLFISVRERQGLAYLIRSSMDSFVDTGEFTIQAGLDKGRLPLAVETILAEVAKIKAEGPTLQELKDAKNNLRGRSLLSLEDSSEVAEWHAKQEIFLGRVESPEDWLKKHDAVTAVDVVNVAKDLLDPAKMSVAAIGPYHDSEEFLMASGLKK